MHPITSPTACRHCGSRTPFGAAFCCAGCESVHALLEANGLLRYYSLAERLAPVRALAAAAVPPGIGEETKLYLEGVHCLGCLWILERLPEMNPGIRQATLDVAHGILDVRIDAGRTSWEEVVRLVGSLGYPARFLRSGTEDESRAEERRLLSRIGVAAFAAGNLMVLSAALYAGADSRWASLFPWLSLVLFLPVLLYSASPIFRQAFPPLRHGIISVDLPIALALLAGFALSLVSLSRGEPHVYFDSLAMLTFLLLSSRYLLSRFRRSLALEPAFLSFFSESLFERVSPEPGRVRAESLQPGDELQLSAGEMLPVDAVALEPAYFDLSLLTGESLPVKVLAGDRVEAGAKSMGAARLRTELPAAASRLAGILSQLGSYRRSPAVDFAGKVGRGFSVVVLSLAAGLVLFLPDPADSWQRALALVIVTCPCVLAYAIPLAFTRSLQRAARKGILFRNPEKVEELATAATLFLDKTGTVTTGAFEVLSFSPFDEETLAAVAALEEGCPHPVAKALVRLARLHLHGPVPEARGVEPVSGGRTGEVNDEIWTVRRWPGPVEGTENVVEVLRGCERKARITLGDSLRPDSASLVQEAKDLGLRPVLLSGDGTRAVKLAAERLGIDEWHGLLEPEDKARVLAATKGSIMVGDGANDAIAFRAASVGVAVQGSVELSLRNADLALGTPGLGAVLEAVCFARETMSLVRANFLFSLSYNVAAGAVALSGHMSPLLAAVLMPCSALTVFLFTCWRTREGR